MRTLLLVLSLCTAAACVGEADDEPVAPDAGVTELPEGHPPVEIQGAALVKEFPGKPAPRDGQVETGRSCLTCHVNGELP